ncbi:sulfatase [Candidatus Hydrogenedentota bacterium]
MNVFVFLADSLRPDYMGCYGNDWIKTPNMDAFAKRSTMFTRAYSEGMPTLPARTAMFTGRYTFPFSGWQKLDTTYTTLAELLWKEEMTSAMITDVHHLHKPGMGYERGFDFVHFIRGQEGDPFIKDGPLRVPVEDHFKEVEIPEEQIKMYPGATKLSVENFRNQLVQYLRNSAHFEKEEDFFAAQVVTSAMNWVDAQKRRDNLFMWIDCFDPHEPWDPPANYIDLYADRNPGYTGKHLIHPVPMPVEGYLTPEEEADIRNLYAAEITYVDTWFGKFIAKLEEHGLMENSMIILLSDHGEPLGSGIHGHGIIRKARSWPYEDLARIPCIIYIPENKKVDVTPAFAETCDVFPTIMDFLGLECPDYVHGQNLLPIIKGEKDSVRDFAVAAFHKASWKIRDDRWSFILFWPDKFGNTAPSELYDLENDQWETNNIIDQHPEIANRLEVALRSFAEGLK